MVMIPEGKIEYQRIMAQSLLNAIKAITEEGFAVTRAEAVDPMNMVIHFAYLGNSGSLINDPVTK
jgi:hypothetical protein